MSFRPALKWHRLRQVRTDCAFGLTSMLQGAACGASMEVDLRALSDGDFVCLHDATVDRETNAAGPVRDFTSSDVGSMLMRSDDGRLTEVRPMLLGDLAAAMGGEAVHPDALMQLDFKDDIGTLSEEHRQRFHDCLASCASRFILSGDDPAGLLSLGAGLSGLKVGYDPCRDDTLASLQRTGAFEAFARDAARAVPFAAYAYLEYPIILAGLDAGVNVVSIFRSAGIKVDAYTLNADHSRVEETLGRLVQAGVDQITTDEPLVLERLLSRVIPQRG
ncbi:glycerophosphodiester phosphodiesterase [Sinorhizobium sp. A49]|uniref:glycerophosphodiester phosphodiesterase n=1 Tax=Sinorhizobium sp. A49 TaxID=1945861 RepID=UPI0009851B38|nr:glycerophosphodiester phosphodiesterase family protein [Sinorhizobium sp. A49]OOG65216.1 hypothetical protein B0E45_27145 [Sinorhizobium sp. A49]